METIENFLRRIWRWLGVEKTVSCEEMKRSPLTILVIGTSKPTEAEISKLNSLRPEWEFAHISKSLSLEEFSIWTRILRKSAEILYRKYKIPLVLVFLSDQSSPFRSALEGNINKGEIEIWEI